MRNLVYIRSHVDRHAHRYIQTLHTNEIDAEFWMNENGLNYRLNSDLQEVKIEIINLRGQTIGKFMLNGRSGVIQLPAKTQGAHFMRITSNNQQFYRKIMSF